MASRKGPKIPPGYCIKPVDCLCEDGDEWGPSEMECVLETPLGSLLVCAQDDRAVYLLAMPDASRALRSAVQAIMAEEDGMSFSDDTRAKSFAGKLARRLAARDLVRGARA